MKLNAIENINSNINKVIDAKGGSLFELPFISIKNIIPFPAMTISVISEKTKNLMAASSAIKADKYVFLTCAEEREFEPFLLDEENDNINNAGVLAVVKQVIIPKQGSATIVFDCICRLIRKSSPIKKKNHTTITAEPVFEQSYDKNSSIQAQAIIRNLMQSFKKYAETSHNIDEKILQRAESISDGGNLADYISQYSYFSNEMKQKLLNEFIPEKRIEILTEILNSETEILYFQDRLNAKLQKKLVGDQKEHFIREQIKLLKEEINDSSDDNSRYYEDKIEALKAPDDVKEKLFDEANRLWSVPEAAQEYSIITSYLDTCLSLPWGVFSNDTIDLKKAEKMLNNDHYGLIKVKERILETLAVRKLTNNNNGQILCLIGPPGTGKTSIAESIARACNRKFERISLGGVRDESEIRGHRRTYIASMPGRIISALIHAKTQNPVILLDEVDKLSSDYKGDPSSALLEVLDPEQNNSFKDHYLDLPFDLSKILFIATANVAENIPEPLLDRMDTIELSSYTHTEKFNIAKNHLIPKQLKRHGITSKNVRISDEAINDSIKYYTREAGVRSLEKTINMILRKTAKIIVNENPDKRLNVNSSNLENFLGVKKFKEDIIDKQDRIGTVNGLAYTTAGGDILPIEVNIMEGSGKTELTGSLGDVMKESAHAAISYIRSKADDLGVNSDFYKTKDIHFHFPEGAIPKDGPSAGIGMATALISGLTGRKVRGNVAMTGEITLKGKALPIGGLREKTMAAYKAGIKTVIIPEENLSEVKELEAVIREELEFIPVKEMTEVINAALCP